MTDKHYNKCIERKGYYVENWIFTIEIIKRYLLYQHDIYFIDREDYAENWVFIIQMLKSIFMLTTI